MRSRHFGRDDRDGKVTIIATVRMSSGAETPVAKRSAVVSKAELPRQPTPGKPPFVKGATQRVGDFVKTNATNYFHEKPGCIDPGEIPLYTK